MRQEKEKNATASASRSQRVSHSLLGSHTLRPRGYPRGEPRYVWYVTCTLRKLFEAWPEAGTPLLRNLI